MDKKIWMIIVLFIGFFLLIPFFRNEKNVSYAEIEKVLLPYTKELEPKDSSFIKKNYQVNDKDVKHVLVYGSKSAMEASEIVLFEGTEENLAILKKALEERIQKQIQIFGSYEPKQTEILKKAIVIEKGKFVMLLIGENAQQIEKDVLALF